MAEPLATRDNIEALIEGEVSGQVAVGSYNVQIVADHGAVVHYAPPESRPRPRPHPSPILLRPRPFRGLLDRKEDAASAAAALRDSLPVELCGPPGIGKSSLLRHLAYAVPAEDWPDGVVHLAAGRQAAADLLQGLFDAFFECDVPFKPTEVQVRQFLQGRQGLVLVDDLELDRTGVEELLNAAPGCAFLLVSRQRSLWGEGRSLTLGSLPPEDALALFERGLERPLAEKEKAAAAGLCARLEGHPLSILQAAARVKEERRPITGEVLPPDAGTGISALPEAERKVLAVLAALGGGPVGAAHLAALAGAPDLEPLVQDLQQRRLVQAHSPRYSLTGDLTSRLEGRWPLDPWRERALAYFTGWAEANRAEAPVVLEESGALRRLLAWAVQTGRWAEATRLGRALEGALLIAGRWSAWAETLESVRQAAQAQGDVAAEGRSLHQLGTRLLCLDDKPGARKLLTRALEIRESLGDRKGAAITRHNLGLIAVPEPPKPDPGPRPRRLLPWVILPLLLVTAAAIGFLRPSPSKPVPRQREIMQAPAPPPSPPAPVFPPAVSDMSTDLTNSAGDSATAPMATTTEGPEGGITEPSVQPEPPRPEPRPRPTPPTPRPKPSLPEAGPQAPAVPEPSVPAEPKHPGLALSHQRFDFRPLKPGSASTPVDVEIVNTGEAPLHVDTRVLTGSGAGDFRLDDRCRSAEIAPQGRCRFGVRFAPGSVGPHTARIVVADQADGLQQELTLSGAGLEEPKGWCCRDGQVSSVTQAECAEARGQFSTSERASRLLCAAGKVAASTGCCLDGVFQGSMTVEECRQREGAPMSLLEATLGGRCRKPREPRGDGGTKREPQGDGGAKRQPQPQPQPQPVWCCMGGHVFQLTPAQCEGRRGIPFQTAEEARAKCRPRAQPPQNPPAQGPKVDTRRPILTRRVLGYCCLNGSAIPNMTRDQCLAKKGFFSLREDEAARACMVR
jgi:energy-coupling factor transporter ATP-binding protein EcfA2